MKTVVERSAFLTSLARIARIVEDEPIMNGVELTSAGVTLTLHAIALDFEIDDTVPAQVGQPGSATFPAKLLLDAVRRLPDGPLLALDFDEHAHRLSVGDTSSSVDVEVAPSGLFDALPINTFEHPFAPTVTMPARDLCALFRHNVSVPADDDHPFTLKGIALSIPTPRRDRAEIPGPTGFDGKMGVIVPCTTVAELTKLLEIDGDVAIEVNDDCLRIAVGSVMLTSRQVDAPSTYF